jgi:DNA phosphorothioation-dependent restriction protein DptG
MGEWIQTVAPGNESAGEERRDCANCDHFETRELEALGYLQEFIDAVDSLSENESTENTYSELYAALQLYAKLTEEEKAAASDTFRVLQAAIEVYNAKVEIANGEMEKATEIALLPITAGFAFLAALWFLLKKKFWIK